MHVLGNADLDTAVARVLDSLVETRGVCRVGLALTEGGGRRLSFTSSERDVSWSPGEPVQLDWCHIDAFDDVPLVSVVRTGQAVVGGLEVLEEHYPDFVRGQREIGIAAVAALPLTAEGVTWGGLVLFYDVPQRFGVHQLALLRTGAARATSEIGVARQVVAASSDVLDVCTCDDGDTVCIDVEPLARSVALARRFARRQLHDWKIDEDVLDTAVLCLPELVTNVVMHAASRAGIELRRSDDRVVVTVRDGGGHRGVGAVAAEPDPLLVHGRGLQLVGALAEDWGSETDAAGTTVWCSFLTGSSRA